MKANLGDFIGLPQEVQRNILGNLLYPMIAVKEPELAPKITGMLIDLSVLEVNDILEFFEDLSLLDEKIKEAKDIISPIENY